MEEYWFYTWTRLVSLYLSKVGSRIKRCTPLKMNKVIDLNNLWKTIHGEEHIINLIFWEEKVFVFEKSRTTRKMTCLQWIFELQKSFAILQWGFCLATDCLLLKKLWKKKKTWVATDFSLQSKFATKIPLQFKIICNGLSVANENYFATDFPLQIQIATQSNFSVFLLFNYIFVYLWQIKYFCIIMLQRNNRCNYNLQRIIRCK